MSACGDEIFDDLVRADIHSKASQVLALLLYNIVVQLQNVL